MVVKTLPTGSAALMRFAEETARELGEQREGLLKDEALLRAAGVQYAHQAHIGAVEHAKHSANDRRFVEITRTRLIRAENHLCMRLLNATGFALALIN
jgi:hypothetical protein